jgi:hypothetical protein
VDYALNWALQDAHAQVKERGHTLVYLVLHNHSNANKPPPTEVRMVITHIHIRVPQGFAYAIQYALQELTNPGGQAQFITSPSAQLNEPSWTIADIERVLRSPGETVGEGDSTAYAFRVNQTMPGIRALKPSDETYRILALGRVGTHSCQRIGLPEPDRSSKIKISIKAHRMKANGRGTHVRYLQQQMTKPELLLGPEALELGTKVFGGHALDLQERAQWRSEHGSKGQAPASSKEMIFANLWLPKGATRSTFLQTKEEMEEQIKLNAFQVTRTGPSSDFRKRKQHYDHNWQAGRGTSSSSSSTWVGSRSASHASTAGQGTWTYTRNEEGNYAQGSGASSSGTDITDNSAWNTGGRDAASWNRHTASRHSWSLPDDEGSSSQYR